MKVTIVGGGFGGVKTAIELAKNPSCKITLISDKSYFQYYPTLYRSATGHSHRESWFMLREIFQYYTNVTIIKDSITAIDPDTKTLRAASGTHYRYNTLVLALGSVTTYFGIEGLEQYTHGIKSPDEIRRLQDHLFREMGDERITDKHYVIIGAGPTGVELAASLGQYLKRLQKHFKLRRRKIHIDLIEAAPRVLPRSHESISRAVHARLRKLGITVQCGKTVERATADTLMVSGKPINSHTVIWTSGVANAPFFTDNAAHFQLDQRRHVIVDEYLMARPHVYVIGDNAATPFGGLAQTAVHNAHYVARHIQATQAHPHRRIAPYHPSTRGSVVPVGKNWAVFEYKNIRLSGYPAHIIRVAADFIGYYDILPLNRALHAWRAGEQEELHVPDFIK
jgi:NADH dehydrogenase